MVTKTVPNWRRGVKPSRKQEGDTASTPAPIGGLNAVDALANMPPTDAIVMDNWFPQPSYIALRNGYENWATGFTHWVETLLPYSNAAGEKLFAISGTSVYNATAQGAIGAAVVTGLTNARWEYTNFATSGGQFLYAANATDPPLLYDGTTWVSITGVSTPAITGVTTTKLRNPTAWKNRLWFVEEGSMKAWYLPTSSIAGAAQSFDFGPFFTLGGELQTIMTASLTDGSTFDDYILFLSSEGELLLYRGTDPANAATFQISGRYQVGKPIGRRCWFKFGQDVIILTSNGFVSLEKTISIGQVGAEDTVSYKIINLVNEAVQSYKSNFGWQGAVHPLGNKVLINVPQSENSIQFQFVMNPLAKDQQGRASWCRFTNWNAACFATLGDNLYFGGSTYVALADVNQDDNGNVINGLCKTAFQYLGSDRQKYITMVRPLIQTNGSINASLLINVDYNDQRPTSVGTYLSATGSPWDTSPWNTSPWAQDLTMQTQWATVNGYPSACGFAIALYISVVAAGITVRLQALDYKISVGGIL